jgi:hypothetical protein
MAAFLKGKVEFFLVLVSLIHYWNVGVNSG